MKLLSTFAALVRGDAPRLGSPGSRSQALHVDTSAGTESTWETPAQKSAESTSSTSPLPEPAEKTVDPHGSALLVRAIVGHDLFPTPRAASQPSPRDDAIDTPAQSAGDTPRRGKISSQPARALAPEELYRFAVIRWLGTLGAILLGFGALGAGALPVVGNPYRDFPGGSIMSRMLQTSSVLCYVGVGMLVVAWLAMGPYVGVRLRREDAQPLLTLSMIRRTAAAWIIPIALTAPMFTQDIYSYLAQGTIAARGLDPYSAGPVDILGVDHVLARSVPLIWSHSPSPYGPVALGLAAAISDITGESILWGIYCHRLLSVVGVAAAGWAVYRLALRCRVEAQAALWLSLLNPLALLHLVGGIHNEAIMLGLMLPGVELGMRGVDHLKVNHLPRACGLLIASGALISCAGMTKVTGFIALGFVGMWLARELVGRGWSTWRAISVAAALEALIMVATITAVTAATGIGLGWVTGQGGAATIRSWLSVTTGLGVLSGFSGMALGLGDHTDAILPLTRGAGLALAALFMARMLVATFRGAMPPVGGLGISMFVLVVLFPVVHPWYLLWAIIPLAAYANRTLFRTPAIIYSAVVSLMVLPRGLALSPSTTVWIYGAAACVLLVSLTLLWAATSRLIVAPHRRGR